MRRVPHRATVCGMAISLSERVTVNLSPEERAKLTTRCEREQRSESWIVRKALLAYLARPSITERQAK